MADPTKTTRDAVAKAVIPDNSPLGKSLEEDRLRAQEQLAADEANNLVEVRPAAVIPQEAQAFASPQAIPQAPGQLQTFVNPAAPQVQPQRAPADLAATGISSQEVPAVTMPDQSKEANGAFNTINTQTTALDSQVDALQKQKAADIEKKIAEDDANVTKIEPHGFFHGKSTWQKILGGVGMFLGSITPEGARNVANIIDTEINRDIDAQKTNIKLKQDKSDKNFQRLMDRYGSQEAALLAKKRDAFTMLDLHLKKLELNARNAETRARLQQGRQEIELKKQAIGVDLYKASLTAGKEAQKGMLAGFKGNNQNPAIVKDLTERVTAQKSASNTIQKLEGLLKDGALIGTNRALAQQLREDLAADIAKAKFGRSSDSELEVARSLIPDVTSLTQRGSVDKALFSSLKNKIAQDVEAAASAAGYSRELPVGAQKIQ
jgi:hypothetical protein